MCRASWARLNGKPCETHQDMLRLDDLSTRSVGGRSAIHQASQRADDRPLPTRGPPHVQCATLGHGPDARCLRTQTCLGVEVRLRERSNDSINMRWISSARTPTMLATPHANKCMVVERARYTAEDSTAEAERPLSEELAVRTWSLAERLCMLIRYANEKGARFEDMKPDKMGNSSSAMDNCGRVIDAGCVSMAEGQLLPENVWGTVKSKLVRFNNGRTSGVRIRDILMCSPEWPVPAP